MPERDYWLWLAEALHYNPKQIAAVCRQIPSVKEIYDLTEAELSAFRFLSKAEQEALSDKDLAHLAEKKRAWAQSQCWFLTPADENYPKALLDLPDRPAVLFGRGQLPDFSTFPLALTVTGTRRYSRYGERVTPPLTRELAEAGTLIISGLSEGIETIAATEADRVGGTVLGILAGGIDQIYPRSNRTLCERILKRGAVISEFPPETPPLKHLMPYRNRLLSGISDAVLVVEAGYKSGTRITTDYALEQGRDVLAIPGNIDSEKSGGTNRLIQDGATMILGADDIFSFYETRFHKRPQKVPAPDQTPELSGVAQTVYALLDRDEALSIDALSEQAGLPVSVLTLVLTQLELSGHILRLPGNRIVRK